jgi:hypothetical protein
MPGKDGHGKSGFVVFVVVIVLLFGFSPISRGLLNTVNGSFAPSPFSSLSLSNPTNVEYGVLAFAPLPVILTNHTGKVTHYQWTATQKSTLISQGEKTLQNGQSATLLISLRGAKAGALRISLHGTHIYITVPILRSSL